MRSKSTLLLVAIGCFVWYSVHGDRISTPNGFADLSEGPGGNIVGPIDLFSPFLIPFGLGVLVRAIYRKASNNDKASKSALTENSDSRPPKSSPETSRAVTFEKPAERESSTTSEASSSSANVGTSSALDRSRLFPDLPDDADLVVDTSDTNSFDAARPDALPPMSLNQQDPEVQRIQAELNNAREKLELNEAKAKISSIAERLEAAEIYLAKLKSEDAEFGKNDSLDTDKQRVERLQMQLVTANEIANLRAELKATNEKFEKERNEKLRSKRQEQIAKTVFEKELRKQERIEAEYQAKRDAKDERSQERVSKTSITEFNRRLPGVQQSIVRNSISAVELETLTSRLVDPKIRLLVAQNPNTGPSAIHRLLSDPNFDVRQAAEEARDQSNRNAIPKLGKVTKESTPTPTEAMNEQSGRKKSSWEKMGWPKDPNIKPNEGQLSETQNTKSNSSSRKDDASIRAKTLENQKSEKTPTNEALRKERSERRQNAMDDSSENKPTD